MLFTVEQILERIKQRSYLLPVESVSVEEGLGRTLAEDIHASFSFPPVDLAAIDGYAVRSKDVIQTPVALTEIPLSEMPEVDHGEAMEIYAGSPMPKGADAVIPLNDVDISDNMVTVNVFVNEGQNISVAGIDIDKDTTILKEGTTINVRTMALLSAMQIPWLPVRKKPRVGIVVGDHNTLGLQGKTLNNSAPLALMAQSFVTASGGIPVMLGDIREYIGDSSLSVDTINGHVAKICDAEVDIILALGTAFSVMYQHEKQAVYHDLQNVFWDTLIGQGAFLEMYHIRLGEKESLILGTFDNKAVLGVPCGLSYGLIKLSLFLCPMLSHMLGIEDRAEKKYYKLSRNLDIYDRSQDYLHAKFVKDEKGNTLVSPFSAQDFPMLSSLTESDCLIYLGNNANDLVLGSEVEVLPFSGSLISV